MHNTMLLLLFVLLVDGVSGAETDISVIEGDPVTLHTGLTEIINDDTILWKFGPEGSLISQITRDNDFTVPFVTDDERFRGRLQVDPITGSLIIRNTRIRLSGQYHLEISKGGTKPTYKIFNVTVQRVMSGTDGVKSQSVSVMKGESVTLNPDKSLIHRDDLMLWVFVDKDILLAKLDAETKAISLYDAEERFRGRLQLDHQTGSLTIKDTRTTDSGLYQLQIRGRGSMQQFILTVNQADQSSGLSAGAVAGIVIAVLAVAAAAVAAVVIYHRRKISELRKQTSSVTKTVGEDITLEPKNKINKGDVIEWMFGEGKQQTVIAEIRGETGKIVTHEFAADGRFRGRLMPDKTTGSLTIMNSRTAHSGPYTLQIKSRSGTSVHIFFVTVNKNVEVKPVKYGDSVTLKPDTEIQRDEQMLWMFGEQDDLIAQVKAGTGEKYDDAAGEIFRDRLKLDETTGSLTIRNITPEHSGLYKLLTISRSRGTLIKKFMVSMPLSHVIMTVGEPVHLPTYHPKIERDDEIEWRFGAENSLIAKLKGGTGETYDGPDGIFRDRLKLNKTTGDLTILNSAAEHTGYYNLKIRSSKGGTYMTYRVIRARGSSLWKEKNDSRIKPVDESEVMKRVNESAVNDPLLEAVVSDGVNEQEGMSSL